jgi:hypothetical protein
MLYDDISQPEESHFSAYPNPFFEKAYITFELQKASHVNVDIFNTKGQKVMNIINSDFPQGKFKELWYPTTNFQTHASGLYLIRMQYDNKKVIKKLFYKSEKIGIDLWVK